MSHNQILFNSPALHSLKREQLVKLCKMHSLKANGKNIDLIERLKLRAADLPPGEVNYTWQDSDEEEENNEHGDINPFQVGPTRASEQWEMVMDNIEEVEENGMSALSTLDSVTSMRSVAGATSEFGTGGPKSSVKSSLKAAFANSLGRKRAGSSNPASQTNSVKSYRVPSIRGDKTSYTEGSDPFAFPNSPEPEIEPIPGTSARPGVPAPNNARLSVGSNPGTGPTTTIRLISSEAPSAPTPPRLQPFRTTFDIDMGSPVLSITSPMGNNKRPGHIYPSIPLEDRTPSPFKSNFVSPGGAALPTVAISQATPLKASLRDLPDASPVDVFSPVKPAARVAAATPNQVKIQRQQQREARLSMPQNEPFLFGSPLPQPNLSNKQFGQVGVSVLEEMNKRLEEAGIPKVDKTVLDSGDKEKAKLAPSAMQHKKSDNGAAGRFAKAHEAQFDKMDGIDKHYAARRVLAQQPSGPPDNSKKRKSEAIGLGNGPAPGIQRKVSASGTRVISNGVRKKMGIPGAFGDEDDSEEENPANCRSSKKIRVAENTDVHKGKKPSLLPAQKTEEEVKKQQKEREAVKRHLDAARRRSNRGRASIAPRAGPTPVKPSRGFFASAKSLVRNVWNMGASNGRAPSDAPGARPVSPSKPVSAAEDRKPMKAATIAHSNIRATKPSTLKPSDAEATGARSLNRPSSRLRSPIPSFNAPSTLAPRTGNSIQASTAPLSLKPKSAGTAGRRLSVRPPPAGASSLGARATFAAAPPSSANATRGSVDLGSDLEKLSAIPKRKRTISSTLMLPTASSLAKRQNLARAENAGRTLPSVGERVTSPGTLQQITNSPGPSSPTKIFATPLTKDAFSSPSVRTPSENTFAAAGTAILDSTTKPKPKTPGTAARRPRVSRSRVIAKLGQQRAAANGGKSTPKSTPTASRHSLSAMKNQGASGSELLMSAKKKAARQSEFARRNRVAGSAVSLMPQLARRATDLHA